MNPDFPELSRKPALRTKTSTIDPTLRDTMENGMETTRAKFTRRRRQYSVSIDLLTPADVQLLEQFVENIVTYGALPFIFFDHRDPTNPLQLLVRFSVLPAFTDCGWVAGFFRQNCTFELREV